MAKDKTDFQAKLGKRAESSQSAPKKTVAETFANVTDDDDSLPHNHRTSVLLPWDIYVQLRNHSKETGLTITRQIVRGAQLYLEGVENGTEI